MRLRRVGTVTVSRRMTSLLLCIFACNGKSEDVAEPSPASTIDAGDGDGDGGLDVVVGVDQRRFCARQPRFLLCEDFEDDAFPPPGWLATTTDGGTLAIAAGFESSRGLSASHSSSSEPSGAFLRPPTVLGNGMQISFRVKLVKLDAPQTALTVLRWGSVVFAIASPDTAYVQLTLRPPSASPRVDLPFSPDVWHEIAIEVARSVGGVPQWGFRVRYDEGAFSDYVTEQDLVVDHDGGSALGTQSSADGGAGERQVEVDDFLVKESP